MSPFMITALVNLQGGMTEETRIKLSLPELVEPPMKPYMNPFPPKGRIYDYRFVKEVSLVVKLFLLFWKAEVV